MSTSSLSSLLSFDDPRERTASKRRDTQRKRVYEVERATLWGHGRRFSSIAEIQTYVDDMLKQRWLVERFGFRRVDVEKGIEGTSARGYSSGKITLPSWAWHEPVVLHELAHVLAPSDCVHGGEFVGILRLFVRQQMPEFLKVYGDALFDRNVNVVAPPKPDPERVKRAAARRRELAAKERAHRARVKRLVRDEQAKRKIEKSRPPTSSEISAAVETIRRAAKAGVWGPNGSTMRTRALTAARQLEASVKS